MGRLTKELVDEVTSAATLRGKLEGIESLVEAVSDVRAAFYEARQISNVRSVSGVSKDGVWMRIAHVPFEVVVFLEQKVDPNFFRDPKLYYPWLRRHPEYQTSHYKAIGRG